MNEKRFIDYEQLLQLECFIRWYYDMEINVPGIDAINNLADKVKRMQQEIDYLKNWLAVHQMGNSFI